MATTTSVSPSTVERNGSRRGQSHSTPSRSQSTRTKSTAVPPSPHRTHSTHHRTSSRHAAVEETLPPHANHETSNVAQTNRRSSSKDRPSRSESSRSASGHHHRSSRYSADMSTAVANGGGPAPVVTAQESKHGGRSGKSRTTIPAQTGNWVLGKTIGAGSMGKVKLARRPEGGEQVSPSPASDLSFSILTNIFRLRSRSYLVVPPTRGIIRAVPIGSARSIRRKFGLREKLPSSLCWTIHTYVACEMSCARRITGTCFSNTSMEDRCWTTLFLTEG